MDAISQAILPADGAPSLVGASFQLLVNAAPLQPTETKWFHVTLCTTPTGDIREEEECVINVALNELRLNGCSVSPESCEVLHIRELRYEAKSPDEVQKSKLFVVLAEPNLMVSVCADESRAIEHCKKIAAQRAHVAPVELATELIKESLSPVRGVLLGFDRFIGALSKHARQALLDTEQLASLDKLVRASGYARVRLLDMKSGALPQLISAIDRSPDGPIHGATRLQLIRLGETIGTEVEAFETIEVRVEGVRRAHEEMLSRRLIQETEESNQLQKEAELRKQRTDAQWQILGGLSVPIGVALGTIQAFQLSRELGFVVVGLSALVSAGLVYFRNDWFSWLYNKR